MQERALDVEGRAAAGITPATARSKPLFEPLRDRIGTRRATKWDAKRGSEGAEVGLETRKSPLETLELREETLQKAFETLLGSLETL
jgi:hypothetical protein